MGCSTCSIGGNASPNGCGKNGSCLTGGCNKMNTFDWLSDLDLPDYGNYDMVEVSFKNGSRKEFYKKPDFVHLSSGDHVAVESASGGYDIGQVSLSGELAQLRLSKSRKKSSSNLQSVLRVANHRDMEKLSEARGAEKSAMIKARSIVDEIGLKMKVGDVEYQGDKRKITIYYTAEGRVDFRELIRLYAKEFKVKIEMRQIGSRQESARIGGIGSCGRELCCSTWLTDFKSVSTVAARYQNLAINQAKLSGQCGRLKCCLNFELSAYLEVLKEFPKNVNILKTKKGNAVLLKTDIFKRILYYGYKTPFGITDIRQLSIAQVNEIKALNKKKIFPENLLDTKAESIVIPEEKEADLEFVDGAGSLNLKQLEKNSQKNRRKRNRNKRSRSNNPQNNSNKNSDPKRNRNKRPNNNSSNKNKQ